jgi:hypothetical protein
MTDDRTMHGINNVKCITDFKFVVTLSGKHILVGFRILRIFYNVTPATGVISKTCLSDNLN